MPVELATIGTLVTIAKGLVEIAKSAWLFSIGRKKAQLQGSVTELFSRISVLATQLGQAERLTRTVPAWMGLALRMKPSQSLANLQDVEVDSLLHDLKDLVHQSRWDFFAASFFETDYNKLEDVLPKLLIFREQINILDRSLEGIPEKHHEMLVKDWPDISIHLNEATNAARSVERVANEIQGKLIRELEDAAQVGLTAGRSV